MSPCVEKCSRQVRFIYQCLSRKAVVNQKTKQFIFYDAGESTNLCNIKNAPTFLDTC